MSTGSRNYGRGQENQPPGGVPPSKGPSQGGQAPVPPRPSAHPGAHRSPRRASARRRLQRARRQRVYLAVGVVVVVVVAAAVLVSVSFVNGGKGSSSGKPSPGEFALPAGVQSDVEAVPISKLVAAATSKTKYAVAPEALPAGTKLLTTQGKPTIVYIGSEYCPYCAAQRWPLVMALSKFGTFSKLMGTTSSAVDPTNPSTPTFSFYGSTYKSPYISFMTVETGTNKIDPATGTYQVLEKPTALERALLDKWDKPPYTAEAGGIPFLYMAGRYLLTGAQYDASHIAGWQIERAASYITAGDNATSLGVEAAAGHLVGGICSLTNDRPAKVCSGVPASLKH